MREFKVVEILVTQRLKSPSLEVLTVLRTFIGFIFKIRYSLNSPSISIGLASIHLFAMVSAGSRVNVPFGVTAPFRDGVPDRCWAAGIVWKIRACGKRVAGTYRHRHAHPIFQMKNKLKAAKNEKPCLAVWPQGMCMGVVQS